MDALLESRDAVNAWLERYGVKFGIYKNGLFKEQLFPYDSIPRVISSEDWSLLEKGLIQRTSALNCFIYDVYHYKNIINDGIIGLFYRKKNAGDFVRKGDELGRIVDPYEGNLKARISAYVDGIMYFTHDSPLVMQNTPLFKIYGE